MTCFRSGQSWLSLHISGEISKHSNAVNLLDIFLTDKSSSMFFLTCTNSCIWRILFCLHADEDKASNSFVFFSLYFFWYDSVAKWNLFMNLLQLKCKYPRCFVCLLCNSSDSKRVWLHCVCCLPHPPPLWDTGCSKTAVLQCTHCQYASVRSVSESEKTNHFLIWTT